MASNKETALIEIVLKGQAANASLKDMDKAVRALGAQLKNLPKDSQQFADKKAEFQKMSKTFKDLQNDVRGIGGAFNQINNESTSCFGKLKTGALSVFGGNLITNAVRLIKNVFKQL